MTAQSNSFRVSVEPGRTHIRIVMFGELDLLATRCLADQSSSIASDGAPRRVVLDLSGISFIDAAGLRELLITRDRLEAVGCRVGFDNVPRPVTRLTSLLDIELQPG